MGQSIAVQPGDQITYGGWVYLQSGGGGALGWWVETQDANHNALNWIGAGASPTTSGWQFQSNTYTIPSGVAYVALYATVWNPTSATVLRVDDGFLYDNRSSLQIVQNLDYLPYGELISSNSGATTHMFTGDERDAETSLDHTQFRKYSSNLGRWMTPDPAGLAAVDPTNPQSWNRYAYVGNAPLVFLDPLGLTRNCNTVENRDPNDLNEQQDSKGGPFASGEFGMLLSSEMDPPAPQAVCPPDHTNPFGGGGTLDGVDMSDLPSGLLGSGAGSAICLNPTCSITAPLTPLVPGSNLGVFIASLQLPGFATYTGPCPNGDCPTTPNMVEVDPVLQWLVTLSAGPDANQPSTLDNRTNALAHAINATHVQSAVNPCSIAAWYLASLAGGGVTAVGMNAAEIANAAYPYWPNALKAGQQFVFKMSNNPTFLLGPSIALVLRYGEQGLNAIQQGCNALQ